MITINAKEKKVIASKMPNVHIRRTVQPKSNRHRYYMEEAPGAMRILRELRNEI